MAVGAGAGGGPGGGGGESGQGGGGGDSNLDAARRIMGPGRSDFAVRQLASQLDAIRNPQNRGPGAFLDMLGTVLGPR